MHVLRCLWDASGSASARVQQVRGRLWPAQTYGSAHTVCESATHPSLVDHQYKAWGGWSQTMQWGNREGYGGNCKPTTAMPCRASSLSDLGSITTKTPKKRQTTGSGIASLIGREQKQCVIRFLRSCSSKPDRLLGCDRARRWRLFAPSSIAPTLRHSLAFLLLWRFPHLRGPGPAVESASRSAH